LLHRSIQHSLVSWTPVSDRLLQARLTHQYGKLTVIVAYAPTEDSDDDVKDNFYNQLQSAVLSTSPHDQPVVLGDLNAVSGTSRQGSKMLLDHTAVDWLMTIHSGYLHSALPPIYRFWGLGSPERIYIVTHGYPTMGVHARRSITC